MSRTMKTHRVEAKETVNVPILQVRNEAEDQPRKVIVFYAM